MSNTRYNLKRKVADMPPVTAEVFQEKVLFQRNQVWDFQCFGSKWRFALQTEERALSHSNYCSSCRKQFGNDSAYSNHLQSKKHKALKLSCWEKLFVFIVVVWKTEKQNRIRKWTVGGMAHFTEPFMILVLNCRNSMMRRQTLALPKWKWYKPYNNYHDQNASVLITIGCRQWWRQLGRRSTRHWRMLVLFAC